MGSSPRVRGKHFQEKYLTYPAGLIPACAGKTYKVNNFHFQHPAHPRVCGENESNVSTDV